jgi:hypothetical protein
MRIPVAVFAVSVCCVLCFDDQTISFLTSPRALLLCVLLFWLRCEWCMRVRVEAVCLEVEATVSSRGENRLVKENFELSQTVKNLSEHHELLCSIRNTVLKSLRYSHDALAELRFLAASNRSFSSSSWSVSSVVSTPESKPGETRAKVPALVRTADADEVLKSKAAFRRGSMSETSLALMRDKKTKEY